MDNKKCFSEKGNKYSSNPSSSNYAEEMNNKAHEKSPYGNSEPSTLNRTNFHSYNHKAILFS